MSYRFDDSDPARVVFRLRRWPERLVAAFFVAVSMGALAIGVLLLTWADNSPRAAAAFLAIGTGALASVILFATRVRLPPAILFDTKEAVMMLQEGPAGFKRWLPVLPLADLARFSVRKVTTHDDNRRSVHYRLEAIRKDGGFLELCRLGNAERAQRLLARLQACVPLPAQGAAHLIPNSGRLGFVVKDVGTHSTIRWPSQLSAVRLLASWLLWGAFVAGLVVAAPSIPGVATGVVGLLLALLGAFLLRGQLKELGATYVIDITPSELRHGWQGAVLASEAKVIELSNIAAVTLTFSPQEADSGLWLLSADQQARLRSAAKGAPRGVGEAVSLIMFLATAPRIPTAGLSLTHRLVLERLLEDRLRALGAAAA